MTRTYALKRLLEHGPLQFRELREITRWPPRSITKTLELLQLSGLVYAERNGRQRFYRLED